MVRRLVAPILAERADLINEPRTIDFRPSHDVMSYSVQKWAGRACNLKGRHRVYTHYGLAAGPPNSLQRKTVKSAPQAKISSQNLAACASPGGPLQPSAFSFPHHSGRCILGGIDLYRADVLAEEITLLATTAPRNDLGAY